MWNNFVEDNLRIPGRYTCPEDYEPQCEHCRHGKCELTWDDELPMERCTYHWDDWEVGCKRYVSEHGEPVE